MKNSVLRVTVTQDKEESAIAILRSIEASIGEANPEQLKKIAETLKPKAVSSEKRKLARKIAGDSYSEGNLAVLQLANLERLYKKRRELLENSVSTTKVAKLIGCAAITTVHDRRKAGSLIGLKDNGTYKFPLWQFDPEGDDGVINRLSELLKELKISDFAKLNWFNKPLKAFEEMTPIEILKNGDEDDINDLVIEARGVGIHQ